MSRRLIVNMVQALALAALVVAGFLVLLGCTPGAVRYQGPQECLYEDPVTGKTVGMYCP